MFLECLKMRLHENVAFAFPVSLSTTRAFSFSTLIKHPGDAAYGLHSGPSGEDNGHS